MPSLVEGLSRFVGRVEILALGLDDKRRTAEAALARGRPLEAREAARDILKEVPDSLVGLALWADSAEEAWLDHEVVPALAELSERLPFRADIWLRLGRTGLRTGYAEARAALERASVSTDDRDSAREALLLLCDLDLGQGDPARARHWLDRVPVLLTGVDPQVMLRRAELALAFGDVEAARDAVQKLGEPSPLDGRAALLVGRVAYTSGDHAAAFDPALRAFLLETPGSTELLTAIVSGLTDVVLVDRAREMVRALGVLERPAWAAAFAFAEGRKNDAREALLRATAEGDRGAAEALLRMGVETRDLAALTAVLNQNPALVSPELSRLVEAERLGRDGKVDDALSMLATVTGDASSWAHEIASHVAALWVPRVEANATADGVREADWANVLRTLRGLSRDLDRIDILGKLEALAVERERPLRVAIVGEFNAGKSTFINALLGEDVAPTGVLPTTATLHWVAWAPDAFARVVMPGAPDRVVSHAALKATLKTLEGEGKKADRVFIYAPIERLKRIEILDTPGFNAPDPDHIAAARQAFDEAHLAIWLLDATMPFKDSERRILNEIASLGVPIQLLANKADRLSAEAREKVIDHVREGLGETGLSSYDEPLLLSARLALKGQLGDAEALAQSGWPAVETLLSERIVDRAVALRERALRRRALACATALVETADQRAAAGRERARAVREAADRTRTLAARLRAERVSIAKSIDKAIEGARRQLAADVRPLAALSGDRRNAEASRSYVEERFVARLAEPIVREIVAILWAEGDEKPPLYRPSLAVRAVLFGAAAAHEAPATLVDESLVPIMDAAVVAFSVALAEQTAEEPPPSPHSAMELRARALKQALSSGA
ncbi:MAG: dynamin family protein [Polyangiaceae bacterium]|nr:dynamin family protein [Polyangiaceae bacterium]